ncbi:serine/threonine-protein kinase [Tychonema sp. BBK16]|uniref:serine/threonine protein kinase n=1 Tax=Tychonema sp. BBK16 TaxID=2699888 RepID=UPI001F36995F|nr:serine/threonine-protein kinase [Tychonema sp. BBK16]MCF6375564.1 protein kinase [Tychonema sp. BBK16]
MDALIGKSLQGGKYTLEQELGRGGFGITFKATHRYLGQFVVIKTLNESLRQQPNFAEFDRKFQDEARRLASCVHPNIVRVSDFFVEDGQPYMVMDYIPGQNLGDVVLPNRPMPEELAILYITQIGAAVKVVHKNGLLHRDIKPQNIIWRRNSQEVVLIDFGIAREFTPGATQSHTNMVSDGYAPPEQYFAQGKYTPATDVYGLAATLYTLLTGQVPIAAILRTSQPMPTPRDLQPQLSSTVSQAVMRGMTVDAQNRPGSVDEWLSLLTNSRAASTGPTVAVMGNRVQRPENSQTAPAIVTNSGRESKVGLILGLVAIAVIFGGFVAIARILLDRPSAEPAPVAQSDRTSAPINRETPDRPDPIPTPKETPKPQLKTPKPAPIPRPKATPKPQIETPTPEPTPSPAVESPASTNKPVEEQRPIARSTPTPPPREEQPPTSGKIPRIPGFTVGTAESRVVAELGQPTETQRQGYWPNTRTALYDLVPNQITLGYIYDRDSGELVQTEGSFAQSVDDLVVRTALNGMLGGADREIMQGFRDVQQRRSNRFTFRKGSVEGAIERNERDRIYIGVWDENLH